jgi:hypothetical protein
MSNNKGGHTGRNIALIAAAVLLVLGGILVYVKFKNKTTPSPAPIPGKDDKKDGGTEPVGYPISKGSQGAEVRRLQTALIRAFNTTILPVYGIDGIWGDEVSNALASKTLPTTIFIQDIQNIEKMPAYSPTKTYNYKTGDKVYAAVAKVLALGVAIDTNGAVHDNPSSNSFAYQNEWMGFVYSGKLTTQGYLLIKTKNNKFAKVKPDLVYPKND